MRGFTHGGELGFVSEGPVLFGLEEKELKYFRIMRFFLKDIFANELGLCAILDVHAESELADFVSAVKTVSSIVAILEAVAILGCLGQ